MSFRWDESNFKMQGQRNDYPQQITIKELKDKYQEAI
jgi:hypothetical protein